MLKVVAFRSIDGVLRQDTRKIFLNSHLVQRFIRKRNLDDASSVCERVRFWPAFFFFRFRAVAYPSCKRSSRKKVFGIRDFVFHSHITSFLCLLKPKHLLSVEYLSFPRL